MQGVDVLTEVAGDAGFQFVGDGAVKSAKKHAPGEGGGDLDEGEGFAGPGTGDEVERGARGEAVVEGGLLLWIEGHDGLIMGVGVEGFKK